MDGDIMDIDLVGVWGLTVAAVAVTKDTNLI